MSIENSFNKASKGGKSFDKKITRHFERNAFEKGGASKSSSSSNSSTPKRTQEERIAQYSSSKKHHPKVQGWLDQKSNALKSKKQSNSFNVFNKQKTKGKSI